jgi:hypothetical protein
MNVIIFGRTKKEAEKQLSRIRLDLRIPFGTTHKSDKILFPNGDQYLAVGTNDSSRGMRCDKAYVHYMIDKEVVDYLIWPCLASSYLAINDQICFYE